MHDQTQLLGSSRDFIDIDERHERLRRIEAGISELAHWADRHRQLNRST